MCDSAQSVAAMRCDTRTRQGGHLAPLSIAARIGVMRYARGADNCAEFAGAVDSFGWGAAANNIAVMAGAGPAAIPVGLIATLLIYEKPQEHFADYCRMTCSLVGPARIRKAS